MYALGRTGAGASVGTCSNAGKLGMFPSTGPKHTLGFSPSALRQDAGAMAGGQSENADHGDGYMSSGRVYARIHSGAVETLKKVYKSTDLADKAGMAGCQSIFFDNSYLERATGFHNGDLFGQASKISSHHRGRYTNLTTYSNETVAPTDTSRAISSIVFSDSGLSPKGRVKDCADKLRATNGAGNQTFVWEALQSHPEIYNQFRGKLIELGYATDTDDTLPTAGFNWDGFICVKDMNQGVSLTNECKKRQQTMSGILAEIRIAESSIAQGRM